MMRSMASGLNPKRTPRSRIDIAALRRKQSLADEHDKYNLQHNRTIRKQLRVDRRKKRRAAARTVAAMMAAQPQRAA